MSAAARARDLRKGWCPGALRPMLSGDGWLVRLRITGGIVTAPLARAIAACARDFGNGLIDLSGRANLQLRGVRDETRDALALRLQQLGLLDDAPEAESIRNLIASPLAGLDEASLLDIRPLSAALERRLAEDTSLHGLPAKFGFLLDDGGAPSLRSVAADVRFTAVACDDGVVRFAIALGGADADARPVGLCGTDDVPEAAARLARAFLQLRGNDPDAPRRMRALLDRVGPDALVEAATPVLAARATGLEAKSAEAKHGEMTSADAEPTDVRRTEGLAPAAHQYLGLLPGPAIGIAAPFGRWSADDLDLLADAAECVGNGELRLTPWRAILLPGVDPAQGAALLEGWAGRFVIRHGDARLAVAACPGALACQNGTTATHDDALMLADIAREIAPSGVTIHVSGCAKGCAHREKAAITLVGRDGLYDLVRDGRAQDEPAVSGLSVREVRNLLAASNPPAKVQGQ